jgi:predicted lysophospholipase L1 biosynthesis ABC-type transport system permease subunit
MTVKRHASLKAPQIQRLIAGQFANVSSINVAETLDSLMGMIRKMSSGLQVASRLALVLGIFVFLMILMFQLLSSQQDWAQLQMQGLTPFEVWQLQTLTFGVLIGLGTVCGTVMAGAVTWGLAAFAFKSAPTFAFTKALTTIFVSLSLSLFGLSWMSWSQSRKIQKTLRSESAV